MSADSSGAAAARPPKPMGRRGNVTMRMGAGLKTLLQREADAHERSLSEEIELRLRRSIDDEHQLRASFEFADRTTVFMHLLAKVFRNTAQIAVDPETGGDWLDQRPAFDAVKRGTERIFEAVEPTPRPSDDLSLAELRIGDHAAADALDALIEPSLAMRNLGPWAGPIAQKLGPELVERIWAKERAPGKTTGDRITKGGNSK